MERLLENVSLPRAERSADSSRGSPATSTITVTAWSEEPMERYVSLPTGPETELEVIGPSTPFSIFSPKGIKAVNAVIGDQSFGRFVNDLLQSENEHPVVKAPIERTPLPSNDVIVACVDFVFSNINPALNLFNQESFAKSLHQQLYGSPPSEPGWYCALNIVIAFSFQEAGDHRNFTGAEKYLNNSLSVIGELLTSQPDSFSIGAVLAIALFYFGSAEHNQAFTFAGIAARMMIAVGMQHKHPNPNSDTDTIHRQRLFWQCFTIDQTLSSLLGKPPIMSHEDVSLDLPPMGPPNPLSTMPLPNGGGEIDLFREQAKLAIIQSKIYRDLYSPKAMQMSGSELLDAIAGIDDDLRAWHDSLPYEIQPEQFATQKLPVFIGLIFTHFIYYQLMITTHWVIIRDADSAEDDDSSEGTSSMALAITAARASICMLSIIETHFPNHPIAMIILQSLVSSIVILFINILQRKTHPSASKDLALIRVVIDFMKNHERNKLTTRLIRAASGLAMIADRVIRRAARRDVVEHAIPPPPRQYVQQMPLPELQSGLVESSLATLSALSINPSAVDTVSLQMPNGMEWYMPVNLNPELWNFDTWTAGDAHFDVDHPA